ncbi:MAG: DUF1858 domain-containing protein [Christensenellales bacterium]|jgi:hypothetical protein
MNKYFSLEEKVFDVTERHPQLIEFLADNGFENLRNAVMRKMMGRTISVETALKSKGLDPQLFEEKMVRFLEERESGL